MFVAVLTGAPNLPASPDPKVQRVPCGRMQVDMQASKFEPGCKACKVEPFKFSQRFDWAGHTLEGVFKACRVLSGVQYGFSAVVGCFDVAVGSKNLSQ